MLDSDISIAVLKKYDFFIEFDTDELQSNLCILFLSYLNCMLTL